ncbi:type I toxin-antitoxin system Ibs family toxin [Escherichia coli]
MIIIVVLLVISFPAY